MSQESKGKYLEGCSNWPDNEDQDYDDSKERKKIRKKHYAGGIIKIMNLFSLLQKKITKWWGKHSIDQRNSFMASRWCHQPKIAL